MSDPKPEVSTKKKIIILDDDKFLMDMYATKFQTVGIDVISVWTGEELINKLKQGEKAELLLLDIIIPGMTGLDTLEELRKQNLIDGMKVIMLTNQNDQSDVERAKSLGIDDYIVKASATPSEVVEKALKAIGG